jgi:hypothetical protein
MNRLLLIACATLLAGPALAQYKVVGPDGRVTYTDRPPTGAQGQVSAVRRDGSLGPATSGTQLPLELRQVAARFPVVIYTAPECQLCDSARQLLKLRGIPMTERQALHFEDLSIVERQTGAARDHRWGPGDERLRRKPVERPAGPGGLPARVEAAARLRRRESRAAEQASRSTGSGSGSGTSPHRAGRRRPADIPGADRTVRTTGRALLAARGRRLTAQTGPTRMRCSVIHQRTAPPKQTLQSMRARHMPIPAGAGLLN